MLEVADGRLRAWVEGVCAGVPLTFERPSASRPGRGICLYLLELSSQQAARSNTRPPLQLSLRYLVTAWGENVNDTHALLGALAFAALEADGLELEPEPIPHSVWTAFGLPPQPSLVLRVPLRRERPSPDHKRVARAPEFRISTAAELKGFITGPDHRPIPDCSIEIPDYQLSTATDIRGFFRFAVVPREAAGLDVLVQTGNRKRVFHLDESALFDAPVELQLTQQEE